MVLYLPVKTERTELKENRKLSSRGKVQAVLRKPLQKMQLNKKALAKITVNIRDKVYG